MSILSVDNISPVGSGTSVTVNNAATLVVNNVNVSGVSTFSDIVDVAGSNSTLRLGNGANRRLMYRSGNNDIVLEAASNFFYRQNISDTSHRWYTNGADEKLMISGTGALYLGTTTNSNSERFHIHTASSEKAIIKLTNTTTGVGSGDGFEFGMNGNEQIEFVNKENTDMFFATQGTERLRIASTGKITMGSTGETSTGLLLLDKDLSAESDVSDKNNYHLVIRSQTDSNTSKIGIAFANTSNDTHVGAAILHHRETTDSVGSLAFYTSPSSGTTTERMKIDRYGNVTKPTNAAFKSSMTGSYGSSGSLTTTVANVGILLAGEVYDRGNNYNTTSKLFTCPVDGIYMVNVMVSVGNVGSSRHIFVIAYTNGGGSTPLQNYYECIDGNTSSYANYSYCEPWYFTAGTTIGVGKNGMSGSDSNYQMSWGVHLIG